MTTEAATKERVGAFLSILAGLSEQKRQHERQAENDLSQMFETVGHAIDAGATWEQVGAAMSKDRGTVWRWYQRKTKSNCVEVNIDKS